MIDIDITAVIQFVNFIITLVVLNVLLIKPVRELIGRRRERLAAFSAAVDDLNLRARRALADYERSLASARAEGAALTSDAKAEAKARVDAITAAAQAEARELVNASSAKALAEADRSRSVIAGEMPQLLRAAYEKLVPTSI